MRLQDLLIGMAGGEQPHHGPDSDPQTAYARPPPMTSGSCVILARSSIRDAPRNTALYGLPPRLSSQPKLAKEKVEMLRQTVRSPRLFG